MQAVRAADEAAFASRFAYHHIRLTLRAISLSFSHLSRCFLTAASIWALSLDVCSCSWFASALPLSLFVPSPFASRIKYTLCVCTLSFGHSGSMANCWFCRFPLYPPSLSFHLSVCLSVAAFSMRLRHTFLASFFYSFLFCFCPRLVYIFTLEFAPCDDAAVIFQAVFQPTSNAHTHTHTHLQTETDLHIKRVLPTLDFLFSPSPLYCWLPFPLLSPPVFVPHKFALKCISNSALLLHLLLSLSLFIPAHGLCCCCLVLL